MARLRSLLPACLVHVALIAACGPDRDLTAPDPEGGQPQLARSGALKVTPPLLNFTGPGETGALTASSTAGSITASVSAPACVAVFPRPHPGGQSKFDVTATATGSCTITVTDGAGASVDVPVTVAAALERGTLANGAFHTCGLTGDGRAYCWGWNSHGQLGSQTNVATLTPTPTPVQVDGGLTFVSLTAGAFHTCGVTGAGVGYCWGDNRAGQLGVAANAGSQTPNPAPTAAATTMTFVELSAGSRHTCGLTGAGEAYCWGDNQLGQLGTTTNNGAGVPNPTPAPVNTALRFTGLTAGADHVCGLTGAGAAYCWGKNDRGQLGTSLNNGDGLAANPEPQTVTGGLSFASLASAGAHTCGLTAAGDAYCWGDNSAGQLGSTTNSGTSAANPTPIVVSGGLTFTRLGTGGGQTCGLTTSGGAWCWGSNLWGQLGVPANSGTTTPSPEPQAVAGGHVFISISADGAQSCGVTAQGAAYCWGANTWGQLGTALHNGTNDPVPEPQLVSGGLVFAM